MAYVIAAPCVDVKDKACVEVCPVNCIHPRDSTREPMLFIDPDGCIDCGTCEPECPVEAIFAEEDLPRKWQAYAEVNARYYELLTSPDRWQAYKRGNAGLFAKGE